MNRFSMSRLKKPATLLAIIFIAICFFASYLLIEVPLTTSEYNKIMAGKPADYDELIGLLNSESSLVFGSEYLGVDKIDSHIMVESEINSLIFVDNIKFQDAHRCMYIRVFPSAMEFWFGLRLAPPKRVYILLNVKDDVIGWTNPKTN